MEEMILETSKLKMDGTKKSIQEYFRTLNIIYMGQLSALVLLRPWPTTLSGREDGLKTMNWPLRWKRS